MLCGAPAAKGVGFQGCTPAPFSARGPQPGGCHPRAVWEVMATPTPHPTPRLLASSSGKPYKQAQKLWDKLAQSLVCPEASLQ